MSKAVQKIDTKMSILEVAIELFANDGFDSVTFAQIAKRCNISQPAIYNHYSNKLNLLNECAIYAAEVGRAYIDERSKPELKSKERLLQYVDANLHWFANHKAYGLAIISLYFFAGSNEESKILFERIQNTTIERLKLLLIHGVHDRSWKTIDFDICAHNIHSLLVGEVYKIIYANQIRKEKPEARAIWKAIEAILKI